MCIFYMHTAVFVALHTVESFMRIRVKRLQIGNKKDFFFVKFLGMPYLCTDKYLTKRKFNTLYKKWHQQNRLYIISAETKSEFIMKGSIP